MVGEKRIAKLSHKIGSLIDGHDADTVACALMNVLISMLLALSEGDIDEARQGLDAIFQDAENALEELAENETTLFEMIAPSTGSVN